MIRCLNRAASWTAAAVAACLIWSPPARAAGEGAGARAREIVRSAGTIALIGLPEGDQVVNSTKIVHKSPRIIGCLGAIYPKAVELISEGKVKTEPLVTHTFPLDEIKRAFEVQMDVNESIKVLVKP